MHTRSSHASAGLPKPRGVSRDVARTCELFTVSVNFQDRESAQACRVVGAVVIVIVALVVGSVRPAAAGQLGALLAPGPLLLTPMMVALLELIIDPACSVVFEAEPEDEGTMRRPPREPGAPLFGPALLSWGLMQGALALLALLACVLWAWIDGAAADRLRAVAFVSLVVANLVLIQVNRRHGVAAAGNRSFHAAVLLVGEIGRSHV